MINNKMVGLALFCLVSGNAQAGGASVRFSNLVNGQKVKSPVEVCMQAQGVVIEAVQNGVSEGHGHLHILVDVVLPSDLNAQLPTDRPGQFVHLGDGSNCRTLELAPGRHQLRALLANGAHVPGKPVVTRLIKITVE
jgi:hypothetical protein